MSGCRKSHKTEWSSKKIIWGFTSKDYSQCLKKINIMFCHLKVWVGGLELVWCTIIHIYIHTYIDIWSTTIMLRRDSLFSVQETRLICLGPGNWTWISNMQGKSFTFYIISPVSFLLNTYSHVLLGKSTKKGIVKEIDRKKKMNEGTENRRKDRRK